MLNILKEKNIIFSTLLLSLITGIATTIYYKQICSTGVCSYNQIANLLIPLELGSYILCFFFIFFLFLPTHYFTTWFKYIFSWAFPLTVYLTYITVGSSSVPAYGKVDVVRFWGIVYAAITLLFVLYRYIKMRKAK